jgi:hypothetical protein
VSDAASSSNNRQLPAGFAEVSPLLIGLVGISIPVSLLAWAAVTKSTVVLVFAVLAMFAVGAATLTFVIVLAGEGEDHEGSHEEPAESTGSAGSSGL